MMTPDADTPGAVAFRRAREAARTEEDVSDDPRLRMFKAADPAGYYTLMQDFQRRVAIGIGPDDPAEPVTVECARCSCFGEYCGHREGASVAVLNLDIDITRFQESMRRSQEIVSRFPLLSTIQDFVEPTVEDLDAPPLPFPDIIATPSDAEEVLMSKHADLIRDHFDDEVRGLRSWLRTAKDDLNKRVRRLRSEGDGLRELGATHVADRYQELTDLASNALETLKEAHEQALQVDIDVRGNRKLTLYAYDNQGRIVGVMQAEEVTYTGWKQANLCDQRGSGSECQVVDETTMQDAALVATDTEEDA